MKKLLLIVLLASFASVTYMPILGKVLGPTAAYAQDDDAQGNEDPGDDTQEETELAFKRAPGHLGARCYFSDRTSHH